MKIKFLSILAIASSAFLVSCKGGAADSNGSDSTATDSIVEAPVSGSFTVDSVASVINWSGGMVGIPYGHEGALKLANGSLEIVDGKLTAGSFTVDMKTISPTDTNYNAKEKKTPENLVGHLSTDEFFGVEKNPTATFVIKSVEEGKVIGDMTIKGKTNSETIAIESMEVTESSINAVGVVTIDRQKYGVSYKSSVKDMVLSDEIPLKITLVGKK